jgi:hypothetical protein
MATSITISRSHIVIFSIHDILLLTLWLLWNCVIAFYVNTGYSYCTALSSAILVWQRLRGADRDRLVVAALLPVFSIIVGLVLIAIVPLTPHTIDTLLLRWDFGIGEAVRRFACSVPLIELLLIVIYRSLPLIMVIGLAYAGKHFRRMIISVCIGSLLVVLWYLLFPAVGPSELVNPLAARNCLPSMHLTIALLIVFYSRGLVRWLLIVFTLLTALATLSTGQHYFIDLIAALPWTAFLVLLTDEIFKYQDRRCAHD